MHTVKPIDREAIVRAAEETGAIVTVEEHNLAGGLGGAVAEVLAEEGCRAAFARDCAARHVTCTASARTSGCWITTASRPSRSRAPPSRRWKRKNELLGKGARHSFGWTNPGPRSPFRAFHRSEGDRFRLSRHELRGLFDFADLDVVTCLTMVESPQAHALGGPRAGTVEGPLGRPPGVHGRGPFRAARARPYLRVWRTWHPTCRRIRWATSGAERRESWWHGSSTGRRSAWWERTCLLSPSTCARGSPTSWRTTSCSRSWRGGWRDRRGVPRGAVSEAHRRRGRDHRAWATTMPGKMGTMMSARVISRSSSCPASGLWSPRSHRKGAFCIKHTDGNVWGDPRHARFRWGRRARSSGRAIYGARQSPRAERRESRRRGEHRRGPPVARYSQRRSGCNAGAAGPDFTPRGPPPGFG